MSEQRITQTPDSGRNDHPPPGITQRPNDMGISNLTHPPDPPMRTSFCLRLTGGAVAAMLFVVLCWGMSKSDYSETRMLAGPMWFLQTWGTEGHIIGVVAILILLPCIFAVSVWRNAATITLSIIALLCWLLISFWLEGMASV